MNFKISLLPNQAVCLHRENYTIYDGVYVEFKEPRDLYEEVKCW